MDATLLAELKAIVGEEFISDNETDVANLARTTLPEGTRPIGVIRPVDRDQIQRILRVVSSHGVPVYPVSAAKNWGYGDACAAVPGCLIVNLSRMNRIVEVNAPLAYAVVEPGVTQGRLARYLEDHRLPLSIDCTGAGPDASLIGNTVERGFGHSPYGHRFTRSCAFEMVLADGRVLSTGFGSYPNAQAAHVYKEGMGPSLDGLLTQSNFGVITRMTLWLMPKPERFSMFVVTLKDPGAIGPLVDALCRLRLQGTLRSAIHCFNDRRLLASATRFPYDQTDGRTALEVGRPDVLNRLCRAFHIAAWTASGSLSGSAAEVRAAQKTARAVLRRLPGLERVIFLTEREFAFSQWVSRLLRRLVPKHPLLRLLDNLRLGFDLLNGKPSYETLHGAHWRARGDAGPTQDALLSGSGLIWISPVLAMTAEAVEGLRRLAEPVFHEFGFEYQVTLSCINERALCAVMSICFDKRSGEETARARQCEEKLVSVLVSNGFIPYRGSSVAQRALWKAAPDYWKALSQLKAAWDPQKTIAPEHYLP